MRGKTLSPNNNTTSSPVVVPLPDLLAQKPAGVAQPEPQEILDDVGDAVDTTLLEPTAASKKLKIKLPSCLTEPEESAEERKSVVLAAAKPSEDDLLELHLSKKSKVQAMQRSASLDEGGGGKGKIQLERLESSPFVGSSLDLRTEKAISKGEKPPIPSEKVAATKPGEKMEKSSKTVGRQPSKVSDSFSKALGESDIMVSKKKAKKEKKNDVNEKHKKGSKERVYIDTEKARSSNPRNEADQVKSSSEKSQKEKRVEKQNASKGEKSSKDSLLTDVETVAKETDTGSVVKAGETPVEDDDSGSDEIACQYCLVMFKFANLRGHIEKCEKKFEIPVEASVEGVAGVELNSRKEAGAVVHSDDEPADEFAREGREKEEREREMKATEEKDLREKETLEREVKENEERERKKKERKEREDEKEKKKKGTERELKRKEKKKKEAERERKESEEENDKKKNHQEEKKEKQNEPEEEEELEAGEVETGKAQDNKEKGGPDAPGRVSPQGDSSGDEEAQLREGDGKRKGEGTAPQRKRRRMTRGQVMSLHKALGGGSSSEEEEVEEEPLSIWKGGRKHRNKLPFLRRCILT